VIYIFYPPVCARLPLCLLPQHARWANPCGGVSVVCSTKAAGTRARKHLQELKQLAQDLRVLIQDTKNDKNTVAGGGGGEMMHGGGGYDDGGEHEQVGF
jgi:hypothetical protein